MREIVFLTGGTGFLGSYLLKILLQSKSNPVTVLSRGSSKRNAEARIFRAVSSNKQITNTDNLGIVCGDISQKNLGLPQSAFEMLTNTTVEIYHVAALCDFRTSLSAARNINVTGTKNVFEFAMRCSEKGKFKGIHYVSTVAVAGTNKGRFYEKDMDVNQGFNNPYEQSKFEAEQLVFEYRKKGLPINIYRPGIISGDSKTGYTGNFKVFYQPLHMFSLELFKEIPADGKSLHYFTPVDLAAKSIYKLSTQGVLKNYTYHIITPRGVTFGFFLDTACRYFGFNKPRMIPLEDFPEDRLTPLQWTLIDPYIPYFNYKAKFDSRKAQSALNKLSFNWPDVDEKFFGNLFKYCIKSGFIKQKKNGQTLIRR